MTEPDRAELQRLAQLVEVNRERLQSLEQQIRNLEGIKIEQEHAMEALQSISDDGAKGAMVPLGAGVQIVADILHSMILLETSFKNIDKTIWTKEFYAELNDLARDILQEHMKLHSGKVVSIQTSMILLKTSFEHILETMIGKRFLY